MGHVTSIGLDVHAHSIVACAFNPHTGEVERRSFGYEPEAVAEWALSFESPLCVYETGPTGFHLCRRLRELGVGCVLGAVSKMQKPAADRRRKTDRRDALFLARLLALGEVTEVHVPDEECEAARDLSRALADARDDLAAAKQRLSKYLLRNGHVYPTENEAGRPQGTWTRAHWKWIRAVRMPHRAARDALENYIDAVERAQDRKDSLERKVRALAAEPRWKPTVDALRCMKGIETVTALALACEVDGFSRFDGAGAFASWLGLTPSDNSSGARVRRGGITKAGNAHLRRLLVEAAWHYPGASGHAKPLGRGQEVPPAVRAHANKGCRRLVDRRAALAGSGKGKAVANCATARELACWCWALGCMVETAS